MASEGSGDPGVPGVNPETRSMGLRDSQKLQGELVTISEMTLQVEDHKGG